MCGRQTSPPSYPAPLTDAQIAQDTDNPYKNPGSSTSTPDWKVQPTQPNIAKLQSGQPDPVAGGTWFKNAKGEWVWAKGNTA